MNSDRYPLKEYIHKKISVYYIILKNAVCDLLKNLTLDFMLGDKKIKINNFLNSQIIN